MQPDYAIHPQLYYSADTEYVQGLRTEEAQARFEDFVRTISPRMTQLQRLVVHDMEFEDWCADFSRGSLVTVTKWFCARVYVDRAASVVDFAPTQRIPDDRAHRGPYRASHFSELMGSIAIDMGIYWGECLRVAERGFFWQRVSKPKNNINFNFPAITGSRIGFEFVPWHNFGTWVVQYFRGGEDPMWWPRLYEEILATPRIGEKAYDD